MADNQTGIQMPAGAAPAGDEPVIHVIPEKFFGAGLKMKAPPVVSPAGAPPAPPAAPVPGAPVPPGVPKPQKSRLPVMIAAGVIFLLLIGAGAFFLLRKPAVQPAVNANTAPKGPVCGDTKCEPPESVASCSADCKPPAPVCGDSKCEAPSETFASCAADCPAPEPVCGDTKCEAPKETADLCPADCKPALPEPGTDNDSDGLSDQEEREVFGTDPSSPNTDKDSFVDLNEALNLFDPAKPTPAMLKDSVTFASYSDVASGFSMLRPAAWLSKDATAEKPETMFVAPSGEFVSVTAEEKVPALSIMDWYLAQSPGVTSSQVEPYKTRGGYDAILSPDRQTAYVDFGNKVIVVSYNLGKQNKVQYRVTFQVMVQSLLKK